MTDQDMVDQTYVEPPMVPIVKQIIGQEKPHELLLTLGGQNGMSILRNELCS